MGKVKSTYTVSAKAKTDQVLMMYPVGAETGLRPCLCPMLPVMKIIRYMMQEVICEGNLDVSECTFGSLTIFPSVSVFRDTRFFTYPFPQLPSTARRSVAIHLKEKGTHWMILLSMVLRSSSAITDSFSPVIARARSNFSSPSLSCADGRCLAMVCRSVVVASGG